MVEAPAAGTDRALPHAVREDVAHRVAARVAERFGDEEQGDQPGDQEADGVEEAVVAEERDGARDAEEGRGGHVVAGDREAVLEGGELPPARVEVGGGLGLAAGPDGDHERRDDKDREERDDQRPVLLGGGRGDEVGGLVVDGGAHTSASIRDLIAAPFGSSLAVA